MHRLLPKKEKILYGICSLVLSRNSYIKMSPIYKTYCVDSRSCDVKVKLVYIIHQVHIHVLNIYIYIYIYIFF